MGNKGKDSGNQWRKSLDTTFIVCDFISRYQLYRPFKYIPTPIIYALSILFKIATFTPLKNLEIRIRRAYRIVFPHISIGRENQLYHALTNYMAHVLFDTIFRIPNATPDTLHKFVIFNNLQRLDTALSQGKGCILSSVHICQFFYIFSLVYSPKRYTLVIVANMANAMLFKTILEQKRLPNLIVIGATKFEDIKDQLINHLHQNHCLFLMHDMGNSRHLSTPFWLGKYDFLYHTPQSCIALHRETGAPILPVVSLPMGELGKAQINFLDSTPLDRVDIQFSQFPSKIYYGMMSLTINQILSPYIVAYMHMWEEINNFSETRIAETLLFSTKMNIQDFSQDVLTKMKKILENSYEPQRNDEQLIRIIEFYHKRIQATIKDPSKIIRNRKIKIVLMGLKGQAMLIKLSQTLKKIFLELGEKEPAYLCDSMRHEITEKYYFIPLQ